MRMNRNVSKIVTLSLWYPGLAVPVFFTGLDVLKTNVQAQLLGGIKPASIVIGEYGVSGFRIIPFTALGITLAAGLAGTTRRNVRKSARRVASAHTPVAAGRGRSRRTQRANHSQPTVN